MKYKDKYEILPKYIVDSAIVWETTGSGEFIIGQSLRKKFFIKRNIHIRYPQKSLPKPTYDKYLKAAKALEEKQRKIHTLMKGLDVDKDHIVVEEENFWDDEFRFVTVTKCIDNVIEDDYDLSTLSKDSYLDLIRQTAEEILKLHEHKIIHGDLKDKNIIIVKDKTFTPYIIDFDTSYTMDDIPEWDGIGGTEGYLSPEVIEYSESEGDVTGDKVSGETDIFSLALIFHKWWTSEFPSSDYDGSIGEAVLNDEAITIDKKFDVFIGDKCGATIYSLLYWMLEKDPSKRATAKNIVDVLNDKIAIPEEFIKGSDKRFNPELWPSHKDVATLKSKDELEKMGVTGFKQVKVKSDFLYEIEIKGKTNIFTIDDLCKNDYASYITASLEEPWPEHNIEFESPDVITKKGYRRVRKANYRFKKKYILTQFSGTEYDCDVDLLLSLGLAHKKSDEIKADGPIDELPWPEDGTGFNVTKMKTLDMVKITRMLDGKEHLYKITYQTKGVITEVEGIPGKNLKLMEVIK